MDLAQLIKERQQALGLPLRDLEQRAADHGHPISMSSLSKYASGKRTAFPEEATRRGIAAALDVAFDIVTRAAILTAAPDLDDGADGRTVERATAWLLLTERRTDSEVRHLLAIVRAAIEGFDAMRSSAGTADPDGGRQSG